LFKLPDGEEWRTAMINTAVFGVHTPQAFYDRLFCVAAGPQDRQARSGENGEIS
jgi:catalase